MNFASSIYLDCNATTPVLPIARDAAVRAMETVFGNPSSVHAEGLRARALLDRARGAAAQVLGASAEEVIFTSGATEAIQTAVFSAFSSCPALSGGVKGMKVLYGAIEHKAVPTALKHWSKALGLDLEVLEIPVNSEGLLDLTFVEKHLPETLLLCTMAVNNETGVVQPLGAIEALIQRVNPSVLWMVDSVQALGKVKIEFGRSRIHYATFSGHKLYAPKGVGLLYVKKGAPFIPLIVGGGQERGLRSGTENLPGIAAFGAVLEELGQFEKGQPSCFLPHAQLVAHRELLKRELEAGLGEIQWNTPFEGSVPTTLNFSVPGISSSELLATFDSAGLRVSAGSACSSGSAQPNSVLLAMGFSVERASSAVRMSFGPCTTEKEIRAACKAIRESVRALQMTCLLGVPSGFEVPSVFHGGVFQLRVGNSNTWILVDEGSRNCVIIDPLEGVFDRVAKWVKCQRLAVLAVLDTHSHADHDSIRPVFRTLFKLTEPVDALGWPANGLLQAKLDDGRSLPCLALSASDADSYLGAVRVPTPGHTSDSHTVLVGRVVEGRLTAQQVKFAFTGDLFLSGGLGRTDFTSSSPKELLRSVRQIKALTSSSTVFCPAHDYTNSFVLKLEGEMETNTLLKMALEGGSELDFIQRKAQVDQELETEPVAGEVICGATQRAPVSDTPSELAPSELKAFLSRSPSCAVIDVREPYEFACTQNWSDFGFREAPRNVPLAEIAQFVGDALEDRQTERDFLILCKSGGRSEQVARALKKLGFENARSLRGGLVGLA